MNISAVLGVAAIMLFVSPALADDSHAICSDETKVLNQRIQDLQNVLKTDQRLEADLKASVEWREGAAASKDASAQRWHQAAASTSDPKKKRAFEDFAKELELEARTDRGFAKERSAAAAQIEKGVVETQRLISVHQQQLAALSPLCT